MDLPTLRIDVELERDMLVLRLHGDLDMEGARSTRAIIDRRRSGRRVVVLDLSGLELLDSSGLAMLLELQTRPQPFQVAFVAPHQGILHRLDVAGVRPTMNWVGAPAQAMRDLPT